MNYGCSETEIESKLVTGFGDNETLPLKEFLLTPNVTIPLKIKGKSNAKSLAVPGLPSSINAARPIICNDA